MLKRTALRILLLAAAVLFIVLPASADVWLPASLTEIESQAFMNASWLSGSCTIPEGTRTIGAQAFYNCSGITNLSIPGTVTSIGSKAFAGCTGLTGSVTIPAGCQVASDAFEGCTNLTIVTDSADPSELFTWKISGGEATITGYKGGKTVTSITIPATLEGCPVTAIDAYVFSSSRYLTHVTLPSTLTTIGNYAFSYCTRLTSVTMPRSVTSVGRYAFYYSTALNCTFELIDATVPSNAFTGCSSLSVFAYESNDDGTLSLARYYGSQSSVTVPYRVGSKVVTKIGREAFSYRTALQSVSLPTSVVTIDQSAFYYCTSLQSVNVPYGLKTIGASAFYGCTALGQISLPSGVSSIGSMAFYNCSSLSGTFNFVNGTINASAFSGCSGVNVWCFTSTSQTTATLSSCVSSASTLTVPSSVEDYAVTSLGAQAFYGCKSVTSIVLPSTLRTIPAEAFYKCTTLQSISIPSGVTTIGEAAFYGCTSLGSVSIPASVSSVGPQAFYGCTAMSSVTISSASTALQPYAFAGCSSLSSVSMPGNYSNVGNMAFNATPWLNAKVAAVAKDVTAGCTSDYQRALLLHDWLIGATAYDLSYTHYGSEGVLFHGMGVCNAYTLTYSRLLSAVGISSKTVTGTATDKNSGSTGSHAWTLVQLDGAWFHVDTTWDDPIPDGGERHTYFCLNDAQIAADHTWDTSAYPASTGSVNTTASASTRALTTQSRSASTQTSGAADQEDAGVDQTAQTRSDDHQDTEAQPETQREQKNKRR